MSGQTKLLLPAGGSLTLAATDAAVDNVATFPATTGTVILTAPGASGNVLTSNGTTWVSSAPSVTTGKAIAMAMIFGY